jgi:hypothetical protein
LRKLAPDPRGEKRIVANKTNKQKQIKVQSLTLVVPKTLPQQQPFQIKLISALLSATKNRAETQHRPIRNNSKCFHCSVCFVRKNGQAQPSYVEKL